MYIQDFFNGNLLINIFVMYYNVKNEKCGNASERPRVTMSKTVVSLHYSACPILIKYCVSDVDISQFVKLYLASFRYCEKVK